MGGFSKFIRNITKTAGASGIQFLITLVATPIMTRLYDPSAYATFGILNTAATVIVGIGLFSLPNAYCAEKDPDTREEILQTMVLLLVALALVSTLGAMGVAIVDAQTDGSHISRLALVLLPLLVLTYGMRVIVVNIAIQRAQFTRLAVGQVVEPVCSRGGSIVLGAVLGGHPAFILAAVVVGHLSAMWVLFGMVPRYLYGQLEWLVQPIPRIKATLRRFSDFVFFNTASQQAQQVVMLGMQMGIAACFSAHLAGQYILAISILTLPVSLVALATAPVVYHHFIETEKSNPEHLVRNFIRVTMLYLLAGLCILAPVFFFGEVIFRIAFGDIWAHAGRIAAALSVAYVGTFVLTGVQSILMVTRRLKLQFMLEIGTCALALAAAIFCFKTMDFDRAIFYLSIIWLLRNVLLLCAAMAAALQHSSHSNRMTHD